MIGHEITIAHLWQLWHMKASGRGRPWPSVVWSGDSCRIGLGGEGGRWLVRLGVDDVLALETAAIIALSLSALGGGGIGGLWLLGSRRRASIARVAAAGRGESNIAWTDGCAATQSRVHKPSGGASSGGG